METAWKELLTSGGPWAATTGILLWVVLKAWERDRQQLHDLMTEFKDTLDRLSSSIDGLTHRIERIEQVAKR